MAGTITAVAAPAQTLTGYPSALTVINRAAEQVTQTAQSDPFGSTNPDFVLLCNLLTSLSRDLFRACPEGWTHLTQSGTFTTDGVNTDWTMPAGYRAMVDNTLWNRSTRLPGIGPLSAQQRAALQARLVQIVLNITFMVQGNVLTFPILPGTGQSIAFDFYSTYWVVANGGTVATKDRATAKDDILLFDEELLVSGLVLRYNENRGFDTQKNEERYRTLLDDAISRNTGASVLRMDGNQRSMFDRMLSPSNIPEGNW